MLNHWLGKTNTSKIDPFGEPPRSAARNSASTANDVSANTSADKSQIVAASTPHDDILAQLHGYTAPPDTTAPSTGKKEDLLADEHLPPDLRTQNATPNHGMAQIVPEFLFDPFDGTSLGMLVPQDPNLIPEDFDPPPNMREDKNEEMWNHLSRVLDLQSQIAKMHMEMEGIGSGKSLDVKGKGKIMGNSPNITPAVNNQDKLKPSRMASTLSQIGGAEHDGEHEGDEEGVSVADEETEKNKAREDEFAKLADQFQGRKDSISEIMNKLDDLSKVLTEFHALRAPSIKFAGSSFRENSQGTAALPVQPSLKSSGSNDVKPLARRANIPKKSSQNTNVSSGNVAEGVLLRAPQNRIKSPIPVPALVVNRTDQELPSRVFESPVSTIGSLKALEE